MPAITPEQVETALKLMETGESERSACEQAGISRAGFRSRVLDLQMAGQFARATAAIARDQAEKLDAVIDEMRRGEISPEVGRIEVDARKWFASRLFRPIWGDKVQAEVTGKDGGPVVLSWQKPEDDAAA